MDYRFGPLLDDGGVTFRLYAPSAKRPELLLDGRPPLPLERGADGFWIRHVEGIRPGQRYRFRSGGLVFPDLASRRQEGGTAGWSVVSTPLVPTGRHEPLSPWVEAIFCEVHVGTATPEGTFAGLMQRLEHFRDAGYSTLELMPVNSFPGRRNWGYDGTLAFAPAEAYGTPGELRALVDRAHQLGLCIILDVVYNHFGDVDNFPRDYLPEWFSGAVETPWGPGIDVENPMVRRFYCENAVMWLTEYDLDGLRLDAIHEIGTGAQEQFLTELAASARAAKASAKLIIENPENEAGWLERDASGEPRLYTAQWNDDIHHALNFLVTREKRGGYEDGARNAVADLEKALRDGFVQDGEAGGETPGGGPGSLLPPDAFVGFVQNHDQIGNRADAARLETRIGADKLDFVHFVAMLAPHLPMFFMGEEAHMRAPFPYFVDLPEAEAEKKRKRRYEEMAEIFDEDVGPGGLPDPNDPATFASARLDWSEFALPERQAALDRFRRLAAWRRQLVWPLLTSPFQRSESVRYGSCVVVTWEYEAGWLTLALNASDRPNDLHCIIHALPVGTGDYDQMGETLRLGPWSAIAWTQLKARSA